MKVLVTGGAGFIGANLCKSLAAESAIDQVVALDDLSTGRKENLAAVADVELVEGSILDGALLDTLFDGVDAVVHLAARPSVPRSLADPMATHAVNVDGTMEVLEAARRHGRPQLIVASSSSVYGANPALPKREDMATLPVSPYAASKLAAESASLAYGHSFDLPVLAFRFFNVFGPLQPADHAYAAVVPTFVAAALRNEPLPVHGDGRQTRDFTFVGSVVAVLTEALVASDLRPTAGEPGIRDPGVAARAHRPARSGGRPPARAPPHRATARGRPRLAGRPVAAPGALSRRRTGSPRRGAPRHRRVVRGACWSLR